MPVYKLVDEMPYEEFIGWFAYFDVRPPDWRDDDRTHKLMQTFGYKGSGASVFPSLAKLKEKEKAKDPIASLKNSFLFSKMLTAKGGDALDILKEL